MFITDGSSWDLFHRARPISGKLQFVDVLFAGLEHFSQAFRNPNRLFPKPSSPGFTGAVLAVSNRLGATQDMKATFPVVDVKIFRVVESKVSILRSGCSARRSASRSRSACFGQLHPDLYQPA
jgi:hypothetical protein